MVVVNNTTAGKIIPTIVKNLYRIQQEFRTGPKKLHTAARGAKVPGPSAPLKLWRTPNGVFGVSKRAQEALLHPCYSAVSTFPNDILLADKHVLSGLLQTVVRIK